MNDASSDAKEQHRARDLDRLTHPSSGCTRCTQFTLLFAAAECARDQAACRSRPGRCNSTRTPTGANSSARVARQSHHPMLLPALYADRADGRADTRHRCGIDDFRRALRDHHLPPELESPETPVEVDAR